MFMAKEIRLDPSGAFFGILTLHLCLRLMERPRLALCLWAGTCVGLAAASRYYGALNCLVVAAALGLAWKGRRLEGRKAAAWLGLGACAAAVAFVAGNWQVLLHLDTLFASGHVANMRLSHAVPMASSVGDGYTTPLWYLEFLATTGLWYPCFIAAGAGLFLFHASGRIALDRRLLLGVFPLAYATALLAVSARTDRYLLPLYPYCFLYAAVFCRHALASDLGRTAKVALALFFLALPVGRGLLFDAAITATSTRDQARAWMQENLPPGSGIMVSGNGRWLGTAWQEFRDRHPMLNPYDAGVGLPELRDRGFDYLLTGENQFELWYQRIKDRVRDNPFMEGHRTYYRNFWLDVEKNGDLLARFSNPLFEAGLFCTPGLGASNYLPVMHQPALKVMSLGPWTRRPVEYPANRLYEKSPFKAEHNLTLVVEGGEEVLRLNTEPGRLGKEGLSAYYNGPYDVYAGGPYRLTMRLGLRAVSQHAKVDLIVMSAGGAHFARLEPGAEDMDGQVHDHVVEFVHPPGPDMQLQFHVLARDCRVDIHSARLLRLE